MTGFHITHLPPVSSPPDATRKRMHGYCLEIRREVFVRGQAVPLEREIDGLDDEAEHFLALEGNDDADRPVGTARLRIVEGYAKVERVAVLERFRGMQVGQMLMGAVEQRARERGLSEAVLNAQVEVIPFYEKLGYLAQGEVFEDAGIPHRAMRKPLG